ncbi:MAG TPA: DUF1223 domain-containing protein [Pyrinomonadaceae bacterium]|jgi:hypothetical protein|nr:DUF1223 domain-containing protein [Pyrinomonadaceae bacterium]
MNLARVLGIFLAAGSFSLLAEQPGSTPPATVFQSGDIQSSLIELFTSEGCSSCPPAERWLSALKSSSDLWKKAVPVAFHVDYWDRLGWRDRFAKPEFTARQQRYAAAWGGDSVYTPGFVVNGKEWRDWFGRNGMPTTSTKVGVLRVSLGDGGKLTAAFVSETTQPRTLTLNIALLGNDLESDVKRGENSGRKLRHDFVVLQLAKSEMTNQGNRWTGTVLLSSNAGTDKATALAAWVQSGETAPPIQATGGWLKP